MYLLRGWASGWRLSTLPKITVNELVLEPGGSAGAWVETGTILGGMECGPTQDDSR